MRYVDDHALWKSESLLVNGDTVEQSVHVMSMAAWEIGSGYCRCGAEHAWARHVPTYSNLQDSTSGAAPFHTVKSHQRQGHVSADLLPRGIRCSARPQPPALPVRLRARAIGFAS